MEPIAWRRDLLTLANRMPALSRPATLGVRRRVLDVALGSGWSPAPMDAPVVHAAAGLAVAYPSAPAGWIAAVARRHLHELYVAGLAWQRLRASDGPSIARFVERRTTLADDGRLRQLADSDAPVVFFTPHYGLPALAGAHIAYALAGRKRYNTFFASPDDNPTTAGFREFFDRLGTGVACIMAGERAAVTALKALRRGEALSMQPDVFDNRHASAAVVPFLGGLAFAMTGTAHLAIRAGARVVPLYAWRDTASRDARFVVRVHEPLAFEPSGEMDADAYRLTALIHRHMESQILAAPEHWLYWGAFASRTVPGIRMSANPASDEWREASARALDLADRVVPALRGETAAARIVLRIPRERGENSSPPPDAIP